MGKLVAGDLLVRQDIGTVRVIRTSKVGEGRLLLEYEDVDGRVGRYETWPATHARVVPRPEGWVFCRG
ncbi:hypothetical protein ACI797_22550 [Geodermatophilus sp. SYSU D00691]